MPCLKPADDKHIFLPEDSTLVTKHIGDKSIILYERICN